MPITKTTHDDYVCPVCFNRVEHCTCYCPQQYLIWVDYGIQEHVRILNQKGYRTANSCESHDQNGNMYVSFVTDYNFDESTIPDGFKIMRNPYAVSFMYKRKTTDDEFTIQKEQHLKALLDWCINLPSKE